MPSDGWASKNFNLIDKGGYNMNEEATIEYEGRSNIF